MNKYPKRKPIRIKEYDYSNPGYYHVTICTYNRKELFGYIENSRMFLNKYGKIAKLAWENIPDHFPNVEIDEYIVMPNHIHGIIIMNISVGDGHARPVNNLSVIIGSYKSAVTKQINLINEGIFKWQRFFYDHVIRTEGSLNKVREYIRNNPTNWDSDENNIKHNK